MSHELGPEPMTDQEWFDHNQRATSNVPRVDIVLWALVALGVIGFFLGRGNGRGIQSFWINFLFWGGIAQAGVTWAAIVHMARGQWGGTMIRLALMQVLFTPVTLILFIVIALTAGHIYPWVDATDLHGGFKAWWLQLDFVIIRDGIGLLVLTILNLLFAYHTLRPEAGTLKQVGSIPCPAFLTRGWRGSDEERKRSRRILAAITPALIITYACVYSLLAFDMIMSLEYHWFSTLFGGYYFITTLYIGIAVMIIVAALLRDRLGLGKFLGKKQFHDIGKLMLGFCLLSAYFGWSQYLVIWYGDLSEETEYIIHRVGEPNPNDPVEYAHFSGNQPDWPEWNLVTPWINVTRIVLIVGFVIPFLLLLVQRWKMIPAVIGSIAVLPVVAGFFERNLLILPPLRPDAGGFPIGIPEILITLGFAGLWGLCLLAALRRGVVVSAPWRLKPIAI